MQVITPKNLVTTVRSLGDKFKWFHLSKCYCGAPMWQQPCVICEFYPQYGRTGSLMKKGECTKEQFCTKVDTAGSILEFYLKSFNKCLDPQQHLLDAARNKASNMVFPTSSDIWDHFTK